MSTAALAGTPVFVIGAGIMGAGIAQVAAQAGHAVRLFDTREGAAAQAIARLAATLDGLAAKGRLTPEAVRATLERLRPAASIDDARDAGLVIEAIVENLDVKRTLFKALEAVVEVGCVLATNTSSISVTALANGLQHPGRLVGMHFFNPVPLMKLVEVVSGLSTPGFIVNRIARPYYAETLALLQERAAAPEVLDACLRAAGFRMGPCELMDLIGHDTNFAVTQSVYEANFFDKRYVPSLVQRELVDGGLLGRKTGRGFYRYPDGVPAHPVALPDTPAAAREVTVHGDGDIADHLEQAATRALASQGWGPARERHSGWVGLAIDGARLVLTDGRTASALAAEVGTDDVAVFDRPTLTQSPVGSALGYAVADRASAAWRTQAAAWLSTLGFVPLALADTPGLVVARTLAMLINEAADAVHQGVCSEDAADAAMKLGVNYPAGPFEWLARWSVAGVVDLLDALDEHHRGERYRVSPWLRRRAR
jgi:3-hydroxybutyryl-CoA dehydrogenase